MDQLFRTFPRASFLKARFVLLKQPLLALRLVQDRGLGPAPREMAILKPFRCAGVSVALTHVCIAPERIGGRGLPKVRRETMKEETREKILDALERIGTLRPKAGLTYALQFYSRIARIGLGISRGR